MILGKLELTENTDMAFGLDVFGTTESAQSARLVIEGPQFDVSCHCKIENGEVIATIPKLKGILQAGVYESRLEVVVDGKLFCPLREQIELNPLIEFDVKTKKISAVKEGVKVTTRAKIVSEDTRSAEPTMSGLEKNVQKCITEGYEVSKVGEHYIMKKGDLYAGLISETKILKAKKLHESLTDLINGFNE
jgi:hypothetical protein